MASIMIRNLPGEVRETLRIHAAQCGLSLEAYARLILQTASESQGFKPDNILDLAEKYFGEKHGIDLSLPSRHSTRGAVDFSA